MYINYSFLSTFQVNVLFRKQRGCGFNLHDLPGYDIFIEMTIDCVDIQRRKC